VADETLVGIDADAVLFHMEDYLTSEGVRSGVIRADTAHVYNDSSEIRMWGVEMTLFHEDGSERAHVTSEQGTLHSVTEEMTARGNVVLVMNQGAQTVESPELHYDPAGDRIWSDSNSVFTRDGRVTRGTCFRSDLSFTSYSVCNIRGAAGSIRDDAGGGDGP
jgi:LPS export ABC transporter protein LptC